MEYFRVNRSSIDSIERIQAELKRGMMEFIIILCPGRMHRFQCTVCGTRDRKNPICLPICVIKCRLWYTIDSSIGGWETVLFRFSWERLSPQYVPVRWNRWNCCWIRVRWIAVEVHLWIESALLSLTNATFRRSNHSSRMARNLNCTYHFVYCISSRLLAVRVPFFFFNRFARCSTDWMGASAQHGHFIEFVELTVEMFAENAKININGECKQ